MSSWICRVQREATKDELLKWILRPHAIRFASSERLSPEELVTIVLSVQSTRKSIDLLIQSPFTSSNLAIASTAGILLADFTRRAKGGALVRGDLLLVTRQVGRGVSDLTDVRFSTVDLKDVWQVQSSAHVRNKQIGQRPNVIVVPPQLNKMSDLDRKVDTVIIDATHPLSLERLEEVLAIPVVNEARRRVVVVPLGYHPAFADSEWATWTWDFETVNECRQELSGMPADWEDQWSRRFLVCRDDKTDHLLHSARQELVRLGRSSGYHPSALLRSAWGILNRLSSLAVPLGIFEDAAHLHFKPGLYVSASTPSAMKVHPQPAMLTQAIHLRGSQYMSLYKART